MLCGAEQICRRGGAGEWDYEGGSKRTWSARLIVAYCVNTHGESGIDNKKTATRSVSILTAKTADTIPILLANCYY
jgi:hypothetical protein